MNRAHNARVEAVMAVNLCLKITPLSYANSAESSSLPRLPLASGPLCKFAAFHANFKLPSSAEHQTRDFLLGTRVRVILQWYLFRLEEALKGMLLFYFLT